MDYWLKGLNLNCTLKSYTITPIESTNVLKVTMKFYRGYKYNSTCKRMGDKLRKEKFLAQFRSDPVLEPIPFLEPGQSPHPVSLGGIVHATIATTLITHAEEMVAEMRGLQHQWDCLAQEAEKAKKEWDQISN